MFDWMTCIVGGLVTAVVVLIAGTVALNWDKILMALKGKRLAVLGARAVGKTHLLQFLTTGSIPEGYKQNPSQKTAPRRFQLKELDLKIKEGIDVPGSPDAYAEWKELHDQADIVFYLLRADHLIAGDDDVEHRVRADLRHIGGWLEARKPRPRFFIIGTHCDLDSEFVGCPADKIGNYVDKFRKLPIMAELVARGGGAKQAKVVLGSMKTIPDTEALVYEIFVQVTS